MTVQEMPDAMATNLAPLATLIDGLQICAFINGPATPPSIDMWPADPFQEGAGFGTKEIRCWWRVRARVATSDLEQASRLLYRMLDTTDPASVEAALAVGGLATIDDRHGNVSGLRTYSDDPARDMIGCEWTVGVWT